MQSCAVIINFLRACETASARSGGPAAAAENVTAMCSLRIGSIVGRKNSGAGAVGLNVFSLEFFVSPGLCSKQLVIVRGPLIVILPVSDHRGQTFADKGLSNVSATEKIANTKSPRHLSGQLAQVPQDRGKRKPYRKKRKYEVGRPAANTKISPRCIHTVCVRGGNMKYPALRLDVGNFSWGSEGSDVVYNASANELVSTEPLVRNCIVLTDGTLPTAAGEQLQQGKLRARTASRPGQCGCADGYELESKEPEFYLRNIKAPKGKQIFLPSTFSHANSYCLKGYAPSLIHALILLPTALQHASKSSLPGSEELGSAATCQAKRYPIHCRNGKVEQNKEDALLLYSLPVINQKRQHSSATTTMEKHGRIKFPEP
ncbi:hypothetical protein GH733_013473 [Mirounga leonina]|nr:hypothetical protein GH733_013473 [Mirounga leonina]